MSKLSRIVFIGPQGSGKGTQAAKLSVLLDIPHISTGDLFRSAVQNKTETGVKVEALLAKGELVPDELTNAVLAEAFQAKHLNDGYILDGYPRTVAQAKYLDNLSRPEKIVVLTLSDEEAVIRISGRRICSNCKEMYHLKHSPPIKNGLCNTCGGNLMQRGDDTEDAVRERLNLYHQETEPIISHYEKQGIVLKIDGRPSVQKVHETIKQQLTI
jgi:adenylate kinase